MQTLYYSEIKSLKILFFFLYVGISSFGSAVPPSLLYIWGLIMSSWSLSTENPKCRPHAHVWAFTPSCVLDSQEIPNKDSRVIRMKNTHCFSLSAAPPFVAMWPPSNARSISPQIVRYYCFNSECPNNTVPCPSCCDTRSCFTNNPFFLVLYDLSSYDSCAV